VQKIWPFLVSAFTVSFVIGAAHDSVGQTNTPSSKVETRLITLENGGRPTTSR
jgi:hypothetical protein